MTDASDTTGGLVRLAYTLTPPQPVPATQDVTDTLTRLQKSTVVTVLYSAQSGLPAKLIYRQTADGDESREVEFSVEFSDYGEEAGFMVPHHIQRYVQRTLQLDLTVTSTTIR